MGYNPPPMTADGTSLAITGGVAGLTEASKRRIITGAHGGTFNATQTFAHPSGTSPATLLTTEDNNAKWPVPYAGFLKGFRVLNDSAAASSTFTYTVRVNGAAVATVSFVNPAAGAQLADTTSVAVAAGDTVTIGAIRTGSAATSKGSWSLTYLAQS